MFNMIKPALETGIGERKSGLKRIASNQGVGKDRILCTETFSREPEFMELECAGEEAPSLFLCSSHHEGEGQREIHAENLGLMCP